MRSWRHELVSSVIALSIPIGVVATFPYASVGFKSSSSMPSVEAGCAFVRLTADAEDAAVRSTAATWRMEGEDRNRVGERFNLRELPEEPGPVRLMSGIGELLGAREIAAEFVLPAWRPSMAAPPPQRLKSKSAAPQPEFSRDELLKLN